MFEREKIKAPNVKLVNHKGTRAFVDVNLNDELVIKDFRVIENKDGTVFVGNPCKPGGKDEKGKSLWFDTAYALSDTLREYIRSVVLEAYHTETKKGEKKEK